MPLPTAPSKEESTQLFYEKWPDQVGKVVVVQYRVDESLHMGKEHVNTREFHEQLLKNKGMKGGSSLEVSFDLKTGSIIRAVLTK